MNLLDYLHERGSASDSELTRRFSIEKVRDYHQRGLIYKTSMRWRVVK